MKEKCCLKHNMQGLRCCSAQFDGAEKQLKTIGNKQGRAERLIVNNYSVKGTCGVAGLEPNTPGGQILSLPLISCAI